MRVTHAINSLAPGGAETLLVQLVAEQRKLGLDASILCLDGRDSFLHARARDLGVPVVVAGKHRLSPIAWWRFLTHLRGIDIMHAHLFPAFWIGSLHPGPKVATEHSPSNSRRNKKLVATLERCIYRRYDIVFAISEGVRSSLNTYLGYGAQVKVIPNGISMPLNKQPATRPQHLGRLRVLFVGTLDSRKRPQDAVRVLARVPGAILTIIGDGPERAACEALARDIAPGRITLVGRQANAIEHMRDYDVILSTSEYEGFGIAVLEGMASGLVPVTPSLPGLKEVVGHSGLSYSPGDVQGAADALNNLVKNRSLLEVLGPQAIARAQKFDISKTAEKYLESYMLLAD